MRFVINNYRLIIGAFFCMVFIASCTYRKKELVEPNLPVINCDTVNNITYNGVIGPIITNRCSSNGCHNGTAYGAPDYNNFNILKATISSGAFENRVFVVMDMPQGFSLPACELAQLRKWVDSGAAE